MSKSTRPDAAESKQDLFVIVQAGKVRELVGDLPPRTQIIVLDYDVEGVDRERLQISPLDGEACTIERF